MKSSWKRTLLIVGLGIGILLILLFMWKRIRAEGFAVAKLNTDYIPDEVFLVAPILDANRVYDTTDLSVYNSGFTYDEAAQACSKYGATLATRVQLQQALDLSGHWCVAGWTNGDRAKAYGLNPFPNACAGRTARAITEYNPLQAVGSIAGKAFATCYGKKPAFLTTTDVQDFNKDSYTMLLDSIVNRVMQGAEAKPNPLTREPEIFSADGANSDIFPKQFSRSQAVWALTNPTDPAKKYYPGSARALLLSSYNTSETTPNLADSDFNLSIAKIQNADSVETAANRNIWNTSAKTKTCDAMKLAVADIKQKMSDIRNLYSDVSGMTIKAIQMKTENGYLQSVAANVCKDNKATEACTRLLSLDYDVFYKNRTPDAVTPSYIVDELEGLNLSLAMRECELQQVLGSIEKLNTMIGTDCAIDLKVDGTSYTTNLKNGRPITCSQDVQNSLTEADKKAAFKVGRDVDYNAVDRLKKAFEQISPYYATAQFSALVTTILDRLNQILEPPDSTKYYKYDTIFSKARDNLNVISNFVKPTGR